MEASPRDLALEVMRAHNDRYFFSPSYDESVLALPLEAQKELVRMVFSPNVFERIPYHFNAMPWKKVPMEVRDIHQMWELAVGAFEPRGRWATGCEGLEVEIVRAFKHLSKRLPQDVVDQMLARALHAYERNPESRRWFGQGYVLVKRMAARGEPVIFEAWQEPLYSNPDLTEAMRHAILCSGTTPSAKWQKKASEIAGRLDHSIYRKSVEDSLTALRKQEYALDQEMRNELSGCIAFLAFMPHAATVNLLSRCIRSFTEQAPNGGQRSGQGFSTALWCLEKLGTRDAVMEIILAKSRSRHSPQRSQMQAALGRLSADSGLSSDEIELSALPDHGFSREGRTVISLGDCEAELSLGVGAEVEVEWRSKGKVLRAMPPRLRKDFPQETAELKRKLKEIEGITFLVKTKLDSWLADPLPMPLETWTRVWHGSPVLQILSEPLIWRFESQSGCFDLIQTQQGWIDSSGAVTAPPENSTCILWHPLDSMPSEVRAWRDLIFRRELIQPIKQAFRETYCLSPDEDWQSPKSEVFSRHIIKQNQAAALLKARGWKVAMKGSFDSGPSNSRKLFERAGVVAHLETIQIDSEQDFMGFWLFIMTGELHFSRKGHPLELAQVPQRVFSEAMRDLDLIVGVAGVGQQEGWADLSIEERGWVETALYAEQAYQESSGMPKARAEALERLLPRMRIGAKCRLEPRHLLVQGSFNTYQIHLASGRVLIMPEGRSLSIPLPLLKRQKVYLPHRGDETLSQIIDKAFLLADDNMITEPTIRAQL